MRRIKTIKYSDHSVKASIVITLVTGDGLTREENAAAIGQLADAAMQSLSDAVYVRAPLHRVKVK